MKKKYLSLLLFLIFSVEGFYFSFYNISLDLKKINELSVAKETDQIIFVLANKFNKAKLFLCEKDQDGNWVKKLNSYAFVGKNGIGETNEGMAKTPVGIYNFTHAFGIEKNPGIKSFDYIQVDDSYYWVDDINSVYYNKFVSTRDKNIKKDWNSAEHIIDFSPQYKYVMAFDYNKECVPGAGSAFFLHVHGSNKYTLGCVSVPEKIMIKLMKQINRNCKMVICYKYEVSNY